jgi:hypothetical protein
MATRLADALGADATSAGSVGAPCSCVFNDPSRSKRAFRPRWSA